MTSLQKNIKVVVRVRPYNRKELEQNQRCVIKVLDEGCLLFDPDEEDEDFFYQGAKQSYRDITKRINKKLSMDFDRVYDTCATNINIFEECTAPLVDTVLNGYNCSVFVYGATGAGKTFTMLGNESIPGLTYLTMRDLFNKIQLQNEQRKFDVGVSYLEVYNEQVMNLLNKSGPMKLREDSNGVVVSGLILRPIYSAEELLRLLAQGNSNRTQHPTDANAESSRSHAIFQVHIRMTDRKTGTKRTVKLSMIDLAGSERAASTKGIGVRFKEGASINKSLLALGNCINKLADGLKHIPYRDSNLTRILKDSLGGNCQTLMVANVSMSSLTYEDTYNTLKYASRAKKIRTTLKQNVLVSNMPKDYYIKKVTELLAENEKLKEINKVYETNTALTQESAEKQSTCDESKLELWYRKICNVCLPVVTAQDNVLELQSRMKTLEFKMKIKTDSDKANRNLKLHKSVSEDDVSLDSAFIMQYEKKKEILTSELKRWRDKWYLAVRELNRTKKELKNTGYDFPSRLMLQEQNLVIENSKLKNHTDHYKRLNIEFFSDTNQRNNIIMTCFTFIQDMYNDLSANNDINPNREQSFQRFNQIIKSKSTSFLDDKNWNAMKSIRNNENKHALPADDDSPGSSTSKRPRQIFDNFDINFNELEEKMETSDDDDMYSSNKVFKTPLAVSQNPNETRIIKKSVEEEQDGTQIITNTVTSKVKPLFQTLKPAVTAKKNLVTNILSEKIVQVPQNKEHVKNGLLKTAIGGTLKENKKYSPSRVRKSPRTIVSKVANTANFAKRQPPRNVPGMAEPNVRINRAASFRVKKH
ncbi:kinesin-like protein KIF18A isoform X2 [Teleopsis dalmanni]|uniref:kinesin-like protein KIF18A isoform X2 n=1 Tax=Teleopsis dalmanni TaxID=139649 RepID=UPI0018CF12B7|nr:kinesin-like protein KIF18A isoform X2 [Teleopsis dalmanni]XP_037933055.1 kinesin-like protein KIF18A isoform X2 [Teleopsis dalmanni]